jgi:ABC-type antimicrobial peptide transport system ATPase subunit
MTEGARVLDVRGLTIALPSGADRALAVDGAGFSVNASEIVCLVGDNIRGTAGVAARVFGALKDVHVRMISEGASMRNISLVVAGGELSHAVESLHREFFTNPDPAVFGK